MTIAENLQLVRNQLPDKVKLVAVSKTKSVEAIGEAYRAGQRRFGENRVQELVMKWQELPKDVEWHFIGHLQSNKVKQLAPFVSMIHSVDSFSLLSTVNAEAAKRDRVIPVLLEFHIASEETKYGLTLAEAEAILSSPERSSMKNIVVAGVMGMATFTDDEGVVRAEFERLKNAFQILKGEYFADDSRFCEISMGMSDDYPIAVSAGSTMVRIGSKIFGAR